MPVDGQWIGKRAVPARVGGRERLPCEHKGSDCRSVNKLQLARAKVRASSASPVNHFFQPICKCGNEVDEW